MTLNVFKHTLSVRWFGLFSKTIFNYWNVS